MEIRSVSVHLDADVAGYIAKMKLAGAETDRAFGRGDVAIGQLNVNLGSAESGLGRVDRGLQDVDKSARRVDMTARRLDTSLGRVVSQTDRFVGKLGIMPGLAIAGTAALIPLGAAAGGVAAAFAAPIVFAGTGLTLGGLLAGAAIAQTNKQLSAIDSLKTRLDGLTKGTKDYQAVAHQLAQAQQALTPAQRDYAASLDHLHDAFDHLLAGKSGDTLLGPVSSALDLAADVLPKAQPIITATSGALSGLLDELEAYSQTPGFDRFVREMSGQIGPDLTAFGHIVGDITPGVGHLLLLLGRRLSPELLGDLDRLGGEFSDWADSKAARQGVEDFIAYFHRVGPDAASTIAAVARGLAHVTAALAPLGPPVLHGVEDAANALAKIPTPVLTGLAAATAGLIGFSKLGGFKATSFALKQLGGRGALGGGLGGGLAGRVLGNGVVPVYVTNEGFGAPGGPGGGVPPVVTTAGRIGGAAAAEEEAAAAAKAAAAAVRAAGGGAAAESVAAARAFKEAMAAHDAAVLKDALSFGKGAGLGGFLRGVLAAPLPALGSQQINANQRQGIILGPQDLTRSPYAGTGAMPPAEVLKLYHATADEAARILGLPQALTGVTAKVVALHARLADTSKGLDLVGHSADRAFNGSAKDIAVVQSQLDALKPDQRVDFESLKAHAQDASRQIDLIGPHADQTFAQASHDVGAFQTRLDGIHDKHFAVIADDQAAIASLEHLQSLTIRDKSFNVIENHIERNVGPGGGRQQPGVPRALGGSIQGPGGPTSDLIPAWLSNGEFVVRAASVQRYGLGMMHAINAGAYALGGVATYATGGSAGSGGLYMSDQAFGQAVDQAAHGLHGLRLESQALSKQLDQERAQRQKIAQERAQLVSSVRDQFRPQIFGVTPDNTNPWAPGAAAMTDPLSIINSNIHQARTYTADIAKLRRRGLRGGALAQVTTLAQAQQALGLSPKELREITQREQVLRRASREAGQTAGDFRFGKQLDGIQSEIRETNQRLKQVDASIKHHEHAAAQHAKDSSDKLAGAVSGMAGRVVRRAAHP